MRKKKERKEKPSSSYNIIPNNKQLLRSLNVRNTFPSTFMKWYYPTSEDICTWGFRSMAKAPLSFRKEKITQRFK